MRKLILTLIILFIATQANAVTYYIRTDGSNSTNCTGLADAAYDGSGTGEACAFNSVLWATGQMFNNNPVMSGGDDIVVKSGSHNQGYDAQYGIGSAYSVDTRMLALPAGTAENHTTIYGEGWDTGCSNPPELYGVGGTYVLLNLTGSHYTDIKCLRITDHDTCISLHAAGGDSCTNNSTEESGQTGIYAESGSNITLTDVTVLGLGKTGIHADSISNWTLTNVVAKYNGWAGINLDIDAAADDYGTMVFDNVSVLYNGCADDYPNDAPKNCWGQSQGGYGDGFGTGEITGTSWTFRDSNFSHNTSDGLDMLYKSSNSASLLIERVRAEGNAGNQIKMRTSASMENSVAVGNCQYFAGKSFTLFDPAQSGRSGTNCNNDGVCDANENYTSCFCSEEPCGGAKGDCKPIDNCRAGGDTVVAEMDAGSKISILNSTIVNCQGNYCVYTSDNYPSSCNGTETLDIYNTIFKGDSNGSDYYGNACTGLTFTDDYLVYDDATMTATNPTGTNIITTDPAFTDYANHVLTLTASSPAIDQADETITCVGNCSLDFNSFYRGASWDIGAFENDTIPADPVECGNNVKETGEDCDTNDLNSQTCVTQGYDSGTLACSASCTFVTSGCVSSVCGDGTIDAGEECDDSNTTNGDGCSSICTTENPNYELFLTYTESDTTNRLEVSTHTIDMVGINHAEDNIVYKDFGASYFTDFVHRIKVQIDACSDSGGEDGGAGFWALSAGLYTNLKALEDALDGVDFTLSCQSSSALYTWKLVSDGANVDTFVDSAPTLIRYIEIERAGTTLTAKIYTDANYTTLVSEANPTLSVTALDTAYRYLYTPLSYNSGATGVSFSGSVSNLDITAGEALPDTSSKGVVIGGQSVSGASFP